MTTLLFLDTETTGNTSDDRLCQIAYIAVPLTTDEYNSVTIQEITTALYKPPVPISIDAMVVHHITNAMVNDKPAFLNSQQHKELVALLADNKTVFIAHNAKYDIGILSKEGIDVSKHICTLKVARYLDKEGSIPRHSLQYLRYFLDLQIDNAPAHDARGDVLVLSELFKRLLKKMIVECGSYEQAIDKMVEISKQPTLIPSFTFGKHNGKKIADVAKEARDYLEWLLQQKLANSDDDDEDWIYTLRHHLGIK